MTNGWWRYTVRDYAGGKHPCGYGTLVLETVHRTSWSRDMEIEASRERMKRGEIAYIEVISHVEPYGRETIYPNQLPRKEA